MWPDSKLSVNIRDLFSCFAPSAGMALSYANTFQMNLLLPARAKFRSLLRSSSAASAC